MSHNKWPHELEDYPISCSQCKYSEELGTKYIGCTQMDVVLMKGSKLKQCGWYHKKGEDLSNAERTQQTTKPPHLEKGREGTQEKPHANARRNQTVKEDNQ